MVLQSSKHTTSTMYHTSTLPQIARKQYYAIILIIIIIIHSDTDNFKKGVYLGVHQHYDCQQGTV